MPCRLAPGPRSGSAADVDGGGFAGEETLRGRVGSGVGVAIADSFVIGRTLSGTLATTKNRTPGRISPTLEIRFFNGRFCIRN